MGPNESVSFKFLTWIFYRGKFPSKFAMIAKASKSKENSVVFMDTDQANKIMY
jgi:hypothetical protein